MAIRKTSGRENVKNCPHENEFSEFGDDMV